MQSTKVNKGQKVTLRPNNLYHFVSVIEIAVAIRLRLSETRKSGKMQTSLRILLVRSQFVQIAKIQSFPREVLAKHGRNTSAQPYRGMLSMCLYMNSAVLMRENVAEKMYMRERQAQVIRLITTWFISEHR